MSNPPSYTAAVLRHNWCISQGLIARICTDIHPQTNEPIWFCQYIHPARGRWTNALT